jgi:hypothetical protein
MAAPIEEGKKIGLSDGLAALWYILKFNMFCSLKDSYRELPASAHLRTGKPADAS